MPVQFRYRLSTINTGNTGNSIAVIELGTDPEVLCQYRNGTLLPVQFLFWFFTESLIPISGT